MSLGGQRPKPVARQIAEGDPAKRGPNKLKALLAAEPRTTSGTPACPRHLKGRARAAWKVWSEELEIMNLDKRPDAQALEGACVNYARAVDADIEVDRSGIVLEESIIADNGERIVLKSRVNPAVTVSNAAWRQLRLFCGEFGFTPVSRTRITMEKRADPAEDLAKLLTAPRAKRDPQVN